MGLHGYKAYRFHGRFYVLFNRHESQPTGLGEDIVYEIPMRREEYKEWRDALQTKLQQWENIFLNDALPIPLEVLDQLAISRSTTENLEPLYQVLLDDRLILTPSFHLPKRDISYERVYIIDLDNDLFIVHNRAHFRLSQVSKIDWHEAHDHKTKMLNISKLPKGALPTINPKLSDGIITFSSLSKNVRIVEAKGIDAFPRGKQACATLFCSLWASYREFLRHSIPNTPIALKSTDFSFREIAYCILSFAAGLDRTIALVDKRRVKEPKCEDWAAIVSGNDPLGPTYIASQTGYGYHAAGGRRGNAPEENTYRFKDTFVHLTDDLSPEESVNQSLAELLTHDIVFETGNRSFKAILISIRHIVLLSGEAKSIKRTVAMSLLDVQEDDDLTFSSHCVELPNDDDSALGNSDDDDADHQSAHNEIPMSKARTDDLDASFHALM